MSKVWRSNLAASKCSLAGMAALACVLSCVSLFAADESPQPDNQEQPVLAAADRHKIVTAYGKLPLAFEENRGQTDERVKYLSRGNDYRLFLTAGKAVLSLDKPSKNHSDGFSADPTELGVRRDTVQAPAVLSMEIVDANLNAKVTAHDELRGKSNYFIGNEESRWRSDVTRYERVRYDEVYPGIDLEYHGRRGQLEYDFIVSPGTDPSPIRLRFGGVESFEIEADGSLRLVTDGVNVRQKKPFLFQNLAGKQVEIAGNFVKINENEVGFEIGPYDRTRELVIDPELIYSSYLGGTAGDMGEAIAVDAARNVYVVGITSSLEFPGSSIPSGTALTPEKGIPFNERSGDVDAFIVKLNPSGNEVIYSTFIGGDDMSQFTDAAYAVQVDAEGNAYFQGFGSLGYPITPGSLSDIFDFDEDSPVLTKLNPDGNALVFSTRIVHVSAGGPFGPGELINGFVFDIAIDPTGATYFTGGRLDMDGTQLWVGKINPTGSNLENSVVIGPGGISVGLGISRDDSGNIYVTGATNQPLPTTQTAFETIRSGGNFDAFVAKLNSNFLVQFLTYLGSDEDERGQAVATNAAGNVYVTGLTGLPASIILEAGEAGEEKGFKPFPTTPSGFDRMCCGQSRSDAFLAVLSPDGSQLLYGTLIGGDGGGSTYEVGNDLAVEGNGFAHIVGITTTPDFPVTMDAFQTMYGGGNTDAFYAVIDPSSSGIDALIFSSFLGGENGDEGWGLALDSVANAYITGSTRSMLFPTTPDSLQPETVDPASMFQDAFVAKIGEPCVVTSAEPVSIDFGVIPVLVRSTAMPVTLILSEPVTDFVAVLSDELNFQVSGTPRVVSERLVEFDVFFLPRQEGTFNATLELSATADQGRAECTQTILLRGQTVRLSADPRRIDFTPEEIDCGQESAPRLLSIFNNTEAAVSLEVDWRDRQRLAVEPDGVVRLGAAGSGTDVARFDVTYLSPSEQPFSDVITFTSGGSLVLEIPVSAPACGALLTVDPLSLAFGNLPINGMATLPVAISTARPTDLPVTVVVPDGQPFSVSQDSFNVSASVPATVDVTFQPGTVGFFETTIAFNAEGGAVEVAVSGSSSFGSIQITGVEVSVDPTPDPLPTVGVQFNGAPNENLRGRLQFAFAPDNPNLPPDPLLAFLDTGGPGIDFRLPAGSSQAEFLVSGNPMEAAFQPGTLAGTITFEISELVTEDSGDPVDFSSAAIASTRVEPAPPVIQETTCSRSGTTLTIVARGLSTTREITGVNLNMTAAGGANLTFTPPAADFANGAIAEWYGGEASIPSGSTIALTIPLQVQGDFNALNTATISFSNSEGESNTGQVTVSACQ